MIGFWRVWVSAIFWDKPNCTAGCGCTFEETQNLQLQAAQTGDRLRKPQWKWLGNEGFNVGMFDCHVWSPVE